MKRKKLLDEDDYAESLHCAIFEEELRLVEHFLKTGADVNALDEWGVGCIHYAVMKGRADILRLLIQHGADLNVKDKHEQKTALVWALELGNLECLKVLKDSGGVDLRTKIEGKAPIHVAVILEATSVVRFLLENGACVNDLCDNAMSPLQYAVRNNKSQVVEFLLDHGADVNYCGPGSRGITPLHEAVFNNNVDVTHLLLDNGADVNVHCQAKCQTPTHCAAKHGFQTILESLHVFGADLEARTSDYRRDQPLHVAAEHGQLGAVQFLVDSGAPVLATNGWGYTPLHVAVLAGHRPVVQFLLRHTPVDIPSVHRGATPLVLALETEFLCVVEVLLAAGANPFLADCAGYTPLHTAASRGNIAFLETVGLDGFYMGIPLMNLAAANNHQGVVEWLVSKGVPCDLTDNTGCTALHHAACPGHTEMVDLLIRKGANCDAVDASGHTPLFYAMAHGWESTVRTLVRARATFNLPFAPRFESPSDLEAIMAQMKIVMPYVDKRSGHTREGHRAIHYAVLAGLLETVTKLLDDGEDVNQTNDFGATPLICAVNLGRLDHVLLLLQRGADANRGIASLDNRTAMHFAALTGKTLVLRTLLDHGAEVDSVTQPEGRTPLFWAVCAGNVDAVKLLVERGANVFHRDAEGYIPRAIAIFAGHTDIESYLSVRTTQAQCSPGA